MSKKQQEEELTVDELRAALESAENQIAVLAQNQQGFSQENNKLRQVIQDLQSGKEVPLIYSKMLAVKKDIGSVEKDQKNSGQGWKFRGIDQFVNALHPILNKHNVGILPEVIQHAEPKFVTSEKFDKEGKIIAKKTSKNTHVTVKYKFFAEDGSSVDVVMPAEGVDPGDKGTNKALSAAFKYALIQTFCVPTEDMAEADLENASLDGEETTSSAPKKKVTKKKASGSSRSKKTFRKPKEVPRTEEQGII